MSDEGRLIAGRYRLAEQVGQGGMGTVWVAEDEVLGRRVALKQLHTQPQLSSDELDTLYERTRREARSAARVTHPNVIVVHDVVDDDGRPCIVMEYVTGSTLGDLLQGGTAVPPGEAARIGLGMIAALRAAHTAGVLHRDVKPGNVLLGAEDRVVLTDFGIAMTVGASTLTKTGEMVGSIDYMAPERIRGQQPGPASDLWSLGATLYQAVEGRPPFRRDTAVETAYAIAVDPLEPMKQAGPLEPLIETLLSKSPDERPSAEQTERALRAVRAGETTAALPTASGPGSTSRLGTESGSAGRPGTASGHVPEGRSGDGPSSGSGPGPADGDRRGGRGKLRGGPGAVAVAAATVVALAAGTVFYVMTQHGRPDAARAHGERTAAKLSSAPSPVPAGYRLVRDKQLGVAFPVPDGWKVSSRTAEEVVCIDPTGLIRLAIGTVSPAGANPVYHFKDIEANTKVNYPTSYRRLRMQETTFRGRPAAVWEFTFHGRARPFRAIDLGFGRDGGQEYDIYLSAPEAKWDTYRPAFDVVRDGFRTTAG
ncbi:serine/threonine-protein kinase [Streptomyces sp. TRM68367]|uniref:serine/threonine-protein kinase n=1 Tax=Streptomyces sp. TRM68367 TaxID=2758415 RepID=UPI00165BEA1B|nr:serine/threonine-protein kinase [Streptomyces sp. TRM68367]MBC9731325.1 serine/threonine protein kinase [Streptomyces sp. TRM68367]